MTKKAILLINFGSPQEPTKASVSQYLKEVFSDKEMIPFPRFLGPLLVPTLLVPYESRKLAGRYKKIWTSAGSPFLVSCEEIGKKLAERLSPDWHVFVAMRYGKPSFQEVISKMQKAKISQVTVVPLFPQWTDVVTGSFLRAVFAELSKTDRFEKISCVTQFHSHPDFIASLADSAKALPITSYDHILFCYHGIPERLTRTSCPKYVSDCHETAELVADQLRIPHSKYSIAFGSKSGPGRWTGPSSFDAVAKLGACGLKKIAVFCPSHIVPSLETLYEVGVELKRHFQKHGGEVLDLIAPPCNSSSFITLLEKVTR